MGSGLGEKIEGEAMTAEEGVHDVAEGSRTVRKRYRSVQLNQFFPNPKWKHTTFVDHINNFIFVGKDLPMGN